MSDKGPRVIVSGLDVADADAMAEAVREEFPELTVRVKT